jgi:hypothetical protein
VKRSVLGAIILVLALALPASAVSAAPAGKTTICHKGVTITVSDNALKAHYRHGDTKGACGAPSTGTTVRVLKNTVPADSSKWSFVVTNGSNTTYATWTDRSTPFDSGALTITNPTQIEIDEWAGTGFDIAAYTPSVACTDNGSAMTPAVAQFYNPPVTPQRYYVLFPVQAGHAYVCTFTNTRKVSTLYNVTGNAAAFACATGTTNTTLPTASSVLWRKVGTTVSATITLSGALANTTFDVWVEQNPGTCPPGSSTASNPAAIATNASGNGTATITFTPMAGAVNFWLTLWAPGQVQGLRTLATVPLP